MSIVSTINSKISALFKAAHNKKAQNEGFLIDQAGRHCPMSIVSEIDIARDALVNELVDKAIEINLQLTEFAQQSLAEVQTFCDLSATESKTSITIGKSGVTLPAYNGLRAVKLVKSPRFVMTEKIAVAKQKIDELIKKRGLEIDSFIKDMALDAFSPGPSGQVSISKLIALKNRDYKNYPEWPDIKKALDEAIKEVGRKTYITFHRRTDINSPLEQISLTISKVKFIN